MPRDVNGNFTLDPSNPVVPATVIETGWANPTLSDIGNALTDSLSRTGSGGMLSPFKFSDGTKVAPGESWANEPTSGWYRAASHDFRFAILNTDILQVTSAGLTISTGRTLTAEVLNTPLLNAAAAGALQVAGVTQYKWDVAKFAPDPAFDNLRDLGAAAATRWKSGYFGTSVVTPVLSTGADVALAFQINGVSKWQVSPSGGAAAFSLAPFADNAFDFGSLALRPRTGFFGTSVVSPVVVSPVHDSGAAASLFLKTNNGATQLEIVHTAGATRWVTITGSAASVPVIGSPLAGLNISALSTINFIANAVVGLRLGVAVNGDVCCPALQTTASAANIFIDVAAAANLLRSTSSLAFKDVLGDLTVSEARALIEGSRAIRFRSKCAGDDPTREFVGFGAEWIEKVDARFVTRDKDGTPNWVTYPTYVVPLCVMARDHEARLLALERAATVLH